MFSGLHYHVVRRCGPILLLIAAVVGPAELAAKAAAIVDFPHTIVPILKAHCVECHGGHRHEGDFLINTRGAILKAGVVEPGKAADSHLVGLVTSKDKDERMPKGKPALSAPEVKALRGWIDEGMPWEAGFTFAAREYDPPLRPRRPELPPAAAGRGNAVDRILDAYLAKHHVARPAPLDDAAFVRRVHLDIVGL